jgi:hypothetical protein
VDAHLSGFDFHRYHKRAAWSNRAALCVVLLLDELKEALVLDWRKRQQTRAAVRLGIEEVLEGLLPCYTRELYQAKCDAIYQHVFESYYGEGRSVSWNKDRGKNPDGSERRNDLHYTITDKQVARRAV